MSFTNSRVVAARLLTMARHLTTYRFAVGSTWELTNTVKTSSLKVLRLLRIMLLKQDTRPLLTIFLSSVKTTIRIISSMKAFGCTETDHHFTFNSLLFLGPCSDFSFQHMFFTFTIVSLSMPFSQLPYTSYYCVWHPLYLFYLPLLYLSWR